MGTTTPAVRQWRHDVHDRPFIVIWEVTRACELACKHCRATAIPRRDPRELSTAEGCRLLEQIASFGAPRPLMVLTGGDPFERPDLPALVAHGTAVGLSVALSPSVTPRLTRDALAQLRDTGAKAVSLSLDGASAATHDTFRGFTGVFDATLAAAATVKDLGYRLQLNTTVTRGNVAELPALLRRVVDLGASLWSVFFLVPTGRGTALEPLTANEVEDVLHWLHDVSGQVAIKTTEAPHYRRVALQRAAGAPTSTGELHARLTALTAATLAGAAQPPYARRPRPPIDVNAGRGFAFIDHRGLVYPSGFLPQVVGSVREQAFPDIYRDAPLLRALRTPDGFGGRCGHCEFRDVCGGSRSHAFAVTGDPLDEDPTCAYQPAALLTP